MANSLLKDKSPTDTTGGGVLGSRLDEFGLKTLPGYGFLQ